MVEFGFYASLEEYSPTACLDQLVRAERGGFRTAWTNDHFHPWFDQLYDGTAAHGGNCWSWLPAALERTESIPIGPGVTAPINRYHPGEIAHRVATIAELYPGRIKLGLGTGIALNEHPLGHPWPAFPERARRTAEAIDIIRTLFADEYVDYDGEFWSLDTANLYTGPDTAPPIHVAATGETSARMAGDLGDGFLVVAQPAGRIDSELLPALERGVQKSDETSKTVDDIEKTVLVHSGIAETEAAGLEGCRPWAVTLLPIFHEDGHHDPRYNQLHGDRVGDDTLRQEFLITTDADEIIETIDPYVDLGFDSVAFLNSAPDQSTFFELMTDEVMPSYD
jgi:coenzyme F420-dependent glucose-6-phosphate dehydrogenase